MKSSLWDVIPSLKSLCSVYGSPFSFLFLFFFGRCFDISNEYSSAQSSPLVFSWLYCEVGWKIRERNAIQLAVVRIKNFPLFFFRRHPSCVDESSQGETKICLDSMTANYFMADLAAGTLSSHVDVDWSDAVLFTPYHNNQALLYQVILVNLRKDFSNLWI